MRSDFGIIRLHKNNCRRQKNAEFHIVIVTVHKTVKIPGGRERGKGKRTSPPRKKGLLSQTDARRVKKNNVGIR